MPDIFDQIAPDKKPANGDIFDQLGSAQSPAPVAPSAPARTGGFDTSGFDNVYSDVASLFSPKAWAKTGRVLAPYGAAAGAGGAAGALIGGVGAAPGAVAGLAAKGLTDLASLFANGISSAFGGGHVMPDTNSAVDAGLDALGVPKMETPYDRNMQAAVRGGLDGLSGVAQGKVLAAAGKAANPTGMNLTQRIGNSMQEAPVAQAIGGASAGVTAENLDKLVGSSANQNNLTGEALRFAVPMIAGILPSMAHGAASYTLGRTPLPENLDAQLRAALAAQTGTEAMSPRQINSYVSDVTANSPISAAVRAMTRLDSPAQALANRYGYNGQINKFNRTSVPEGLQTAINNIDDALQSDVNNIPGYQMASPEAAKSTGIGAFLNEGMASPAGRMRQLNNLQAIARERTLPIDESVRGQYPAAAQAEAEGIVAPFRDAMSNAQRSADEHNALIQELQGRKAAAESLDAQRTAAYRAQADDLASQLAAQQEEMLKQRQQFAAQRPELAKEQASVRAREVIDKNRQDSRSVYEGLLARAEGKTDIGTDKLPDSIANAIHRSRNTLGGRLEPEAARILKDLEQFGVSIPEEPAAGTVKLTKTVMPTETGAAEYSSASLKNFEEQLKGLGSASAGRVRALPEGQSAVETVKTPSGPRPYEVQRELVELDDLIHSTGSKNYPQDLQNLNRDTAAALNQKNTYLANFDPEQVTGRQPIGNTGAPIVGPDNVVEGGNIRTALLKDVLTDPANAAKREAYIKHLQSMGYDVSGMKNPVEVMRRKTELTPAERLKFAEELNDKNGAGRSSVEYANRDAMKLSADLMDLWKPGGIEKEENSEFIRRFAQRAMSPNEYATYFPSGLPSKAMADRLDAAFLQRAYNNVKLMDTLLMSPDSDIKSIGRAMNDAAPDMARLRAKIEAGMVPKEHDLPAAVAEAAQFIENARKQGIKPLDALKQQDFLETPHPLRNALVEMMHTETGRQVGGARLGEALSEMAKEAAKSESGGLFDVGLSPQEVIAKGKEFLAKPPETPAGAAAPAAPEAPVSAPSAEPPSMAKVTETSAPASSASEVPDGVHHLFGDKDFEMRPRVTNGSLEETLAGPYDVVVKGKLVATAPNLGEAMGIANGEYARLKGKGAASGSPVMQKVDEPAALPGMEGAVPPPKGPGAVVLEEKTPPKPLTLEVAVNTVQDLNASIRALQRSSEPSSVRARQQLEAIRDGLQAQIDSVPEGHPVKEAAKYWATEHAPRYRHGEARKMSEAGAAGAPDKLRAEETIAQFMGRGNTAPDAKQFASMGKGDAKFVGAVRDFMVGRMASELDNPKAGDVQKWLERNGQLLEPQDFAGIKSEIEKYRDALSAGEGKYTAIERDIAAAKDKAKQTAPVIDDLKQSVSGLQGDSQEVRGRVTQARSELRQAESEAQNLPSVRLSNGAAADVDAIAKDPRLARRAVDAARTPQQRADLENILNEHFNRKYSTTAEIANAPMSNEIAIENLNTSLGKLVKDLEDPNFRESIRILKGDDHLRRLEMLRAAVNNERSRGGMMQGSNVGSGTEPKTVAGVAAENLSQVPTGQAGRIARVAKRMMFGNDDVTTAQAKQVGSLIALNPKFLKELLKARRDVAAGISEKDIPALAKPFFKAAPKAVSAANADNSRQRDRQDR